MNEGVLPSPTVLRYMHRFPVRRQTEVTVTSLEVEVSSVREDETCTRDGRVDVLDVPFEVADLESATSEVIRIARHRVAVPIRLANVYCLALATKDRGYKDLLTGHGLNYPDGAPVVWSMRAKSRPSLGRRVRGPSLFVNTLDRGRGSGLQHFFLGTTVDTLADLVSRSGDYYPGLQIAGTYAPPFGPLDDDFFDGCVSSIDAANPDLIWVALGTPKQDFAAAVITARTGIPTVAVGAAFDFVAGHQKEAPQFLQKMGMEWSYRLLKEPRRLWKRYLIGNTIFVYSLLKEAISK